MTRSLTWTKLSPPGGATDGSASQAVISDGQRSRTSAKVRPSQAPKSVSLKPSSVTTGTPVTAETSSAVRTVRCRGDETIATIPA